MKLRRFLRFFLALLLLLACTSFVSRAEETLDTPPEPQEKDQILEDPGLLFDLRIPDGFKSQSVEEAGFLRWTKDNAEIYVVVGDLYAESAELLFDELKKAAAKDQRFEEVTPVPMNGGFGLLYKDKPPQDSGRLQTWRLVVMTDKKIFNVDFSAPGKEFATFMPDFQKAMESFKLKPSTP